ncbi:MAG: hypothetical protein AAGJ81_01400 [Verrucomicrobiota bacterium]
MSKITIQVNQEGDGRETIAAIHSAIAGTRRAALMRVLGKTHERTLQDHFRAKNRAPNKRNWPKQNFWAQVARATAFTSAKQNKATIAIADPRFATHLYGATITPKRSKYLAIPMRREAYGIRPSSGLIADLFFIRSQAAKGGFLAKREGGALRVYYRLLKRVVVPTDPEALPDENSSIEALAQAATSFISREAQRAKANGGAN